MGRGKPSGRSSSLPRFVSNVTSANVSSVSRNLEIVTEIRPKRAHLVERLYLELASPLACHSQLIPDLDERTRRLSREAEPQFEHEAEAIVEEVEDGRDLFFLQARDYSRFRTS